MADIDLDFERAATLLDVVQKVASIAPAYTPLSSVAMGELKEMNEEAQRYLDALAQERLAAEQEAATEREAERQATEPRPSAYIPELDVPEDESLPVSRRV